MLRLIIISLLFSTQALSTPKRPQGGTVYYQLSAEPTTLNPYTGTDAYGGAVRGYVFESLLTMNPDSIDWVPNLAEKWEVSKDKKVYTFTLREGLKWWDGKPLTTEDVKFSFDSLKDDRYKSPVKKTYLEGIAKAEVIDKRTIKFYSKENLWQNFDVLAGGILSIIPKHKYSNPKKRINKKIYGSGPYMLEKYDMGKKITLKRNPNWWGWADANKRGEYNFDKIVFRFVGSPNVAFEMLKKGKLDYLDLQPEDYVKKTNTSEWGKTVFKVKTQNKAPKKYGWIGWNLNDVKFKDKRVRKALTHLVNRDLMIEKFKYNMFVTLNGPLYPQSEYSPKTKKLKFDIKKAVKLFRQAGWSDSDKNGVLDKVINGKKVEFRVTILLPTPIWEKYITVFKEDAKKAGVVIDIKNVEWNAFNKLLHEKKFDGIAMAWGGGGIHWDPKQIWHSESDRKGGSNFISYHNKKVDKWIDEARITWDVSKRKKILHKVYKQIADDAPYVFLYAPNYELYAHTAKVKKPKETFKYGIGTSFWWVAK